MAFKDLIIWLKLLSAAKLLYQRNLRKQIDKFTLYKSPANLESIKISHRCELACTFISKAATYLLQDCDCGGSTAESSLQIISYVLDSFELPIFS